MTVVLLTEAEVAERLRRSKQTVRRLRLGGKLPYLPGRPPRIDEADLIAFIEAEKLEAARKAERKQRAAKAEAGAGIRAAEERAVKAWQRRMMREGR